MKKSKNRSGLDSWSVSSIISKIFRLSEGSESNIIRIYVFFWDENGVDDFLLQKSE